MTRFILRPPNFTSTPRKLKRALNAQGLVRVPPREELTLDWTQDFFMAYPPVGSVVNAPPNYPELRAIYAANKLQQRQWLDCQGISVPRTLTSLCRPFGTEVPGATEEFVVRPLRHSQGLDYRTTTDRTSFDPEREYLSQVFPKRWEYRVICVRGTPILTLIKKFIRQPDFRMPWNHSNGAYFVTVLRQNNNRLRWTNLFQLIQESPAFQQFHIIALDVLMADRRALGLDHHPYAVCEINFCPGLTIQHNVETIASHVLHCA